MIESAPLILLSNLALAEIVERCGEWIAGHPDVQRDAETLGQIVSFTVLKSGVGLIITIAPISTDELPALRPVFHQPVVGKPTCQIEIKLDPRVSSGLRVPPVLRQLLVATDQIGIAVQATAMIWTPTGLISGFDYFSESVARYADGGPFPVLSLIDFETNAVGDTISQGMELFAGQEVRILANGQDHSINMQLMVRILHDLAQNGAITERFEEQGTGIGVGIGNGTGNPIIITPSASGAIVDVTTSSKME